MLYICVCTFSITLQKLQIRAIRELFHGRFTDTEVAMLLDLNHGNQQKTLTYILESKLNSKKKWAKYL